MQQWDEYCKHITMLRKLTNTLPSKLHTALWTPSHEVCEPNAEFFQFVVFW